MQLFTGWLSVPWPNRPLSVLSLIGAVIVSLCFAGPVPGQKPQSSSPSQTGPERIDPIAAADAFAGQTVADQTMAMKLIQARNAKVPKVGQAAPDFELRTADGKQTVRLSSFRGKRPVVLIFGSHT